MAGELPKYFFRVRDNGAQCFRVDAENRNRRIEMEPIAQINMRSGEVKAQGGRTLTDEDRAEIDLWMRERADVLAWREVDDVHRAIDQLNITTQWAQSKASPEQLEEVTDRLLMAMHDLRAVLVRKKAEQLIEK